MSGVLVRIYWSTLIKPSSLVSIPASSASFTFGLYPMERITASASTSVPSWSTTLVTLPLPQSSLTPAPTSTFTPRSINTSWALSANSSSKTAPSTWGRISTTVTSFPLLLSSSESSIPINPPPITTILFLSWSLSITKSRYSLSFGTVKTFSKSEPFSHFGLTGWDPIARTNFSYATCSPSASKHVLPAGSIFVTSPIIKLTPAFSKPSSGITFWSLLSSEPKM